MHSSYCSLAWLGITTDPDGTLRPCCVSRDKITKDDGTPFNLGVDKLQDIYNSKFYINLRQDMLNNTPIEGCETCYSNEKYGRESRRLISNETFKDKVFNDTIVDINIQYLDLRLGNTCNLKCRMCSPINSSMLEQEHNEHEKVLLNYSKDWFNTQVFDNNINPHLSNIVTLYMTGGEPTLIKKNYDILQRLIDEGSHEKLTIIINTNMTNNNPKFFNLIKQFKKVIIQMSIDAVGDLARYIRYPTDFNVVNEVVNEMLQLGDNIIFKATPCIQLYNLDHLVNLFDYFESFNRRFNKQIIEIRPSFVVTPDFLDIAYLPTQYKVDCYKKVHLWMLEQCKYQSTTFKNTIAALKKKCFEDKFNQSKLEEFKNYNNRLDIIRNIKLVDYNKELYNLVNL